VQSEIKTYIETKRGVKLLTLFGYKSSGVTGLEILGLGSRGRLLKEKIIYLSRTKKVKIPPKKYVLSLENIDTDSQSLSMKYLEFPFLILFWHLAGIVPTSRLDDCLCVGSVKVSGEINQSFISSDIIKEIAKQCDDIDHWKVISENASGYLWQISPSELLSQIPNLCFKTNYIESSSAIPINSSIA